MLLSRGHCSRLANIAARQLPSPWRQGQHAAGDTRPFRPLHACVYKRVYVSTTFCSQRATMQCAPCCAAAVLRTAAYTAARAAQRRSLMCTAAATRRPRRAGGSKSGSGGAASGSGGTSNARPAAGSAAFAAAAASAAAGGLLPERQLLAAKLTDTAKNIEWCDPPADRPAEATREQVDALEARLGYKFK